MSIEVFRCYLLLGIVIRILIESKMYQVSQVMQLNFNWILGRLIVAKCVEAFNACIIGLIGIKFLFNYWMERISKSNKMDCFYVIEWMNYKMNQGRRNMLLFNVEEINAFFLQLDIFERCFAPL